MYIGNNRMLVKIVEQSYMIIPTDNMTNNLELITKGYYDKNLTNFFMKNVKDNMVCVDVGSNIGYFTILFAGLINNGKVISIEPYIRCYNNIIENINMHYLFNKVELINKAVSNYEGEIDFFICDNNGNSSVNDKRDYIYKLTKEVPKKIKINCTTLDIILEGYNIIDYMKIDIEGGEYKALLGLSNSLKNKKIKNLIIEWNKEMLLDEEIENLKNILKDNFNECYYINADGELMNFGFKILEENKLFNILLKN